MPAPYLTDQDIVDLLTGTLRQLNRNEISDISQELQDYPVMRNWLKSERVTFDDGAGWQHTIMRRTPGNASESGLFDEDETSYTNILDKMQVEWARFKTFWIVERRMLVENSGGSRIVDIIAPQRKGSMVDLAALLEDRAWTLRTAAQTDKLNGVPYYIVKTATQGFNGGLPAGHTTVAAVNLTTVPHYKNWTDAYVNVSKTDLIKKMRKAYKRCGFKSPVDIGDFRGSMGRRYRIYMNENTLTDIETQAELQNNQLGPDIASMDEMTVFKKIGLEWIPFLDNDTSDPVYGIDHNVFYFVVLSEDYFRESDPRISPRSHNVIETFVDLSCQIVCLSRRNCFVIAKF